MKIQEKAYTPIPAGNHVAIATQLIDLGTQQTKFGPKRQVKLRWEICDEFLDNGRPFTIARTYTRSMSESAALRGDIEAWRGRKFVPGEASDFDLRELLGTACMLNVVHEEIGGKIYANIHGISPVHKGKAIPRRVNPLIHLSLEPGEFDEEALEGLDDWTVEKIHASPECKRRLAGEPEPQPKAPVPKQSLREELNDDVPF